jgi:hypothetical protein
MAGALRRYLPLHLLEQMVGLLQTGDVLTREHLRIVPNPHPVLSVSETVTEAEELVLRSMNQRMERASI